MIYKFIKKSIETRLFWIKNYTNVKVKNSLSKKITKIILHKLFELTESHHHH